jgi:WD40 repeat protein
MLYNAFISYSHAADGRLAPALQSALHRFARPWYKLRAVRVFRDTTNLSISPHLWTAIETALGEAGHFILLCSPDAVASKWVQREVAFWLAKRSSDTLLLVLTAGEIVWDGNASDFDWKRTTALPRALSGIYSEEPLILNLRTARTSTDLSLNNPAFRDMIAGLAATLHGVSKDEIVGDDVRQHRRTKRLAWSAATALVVLTLLSVWAGWTAIIQRDRAIAQQRIAESGELAARALLVVDTDPAEALQIAVRAAELDENGLTQAAVRVALPASHAAIVLDGDARAADATFALGGTRLVTAGSRGLRVWDIGSRDKRLTLTPSLTLDQGKYSKVVASPDGKRVASTIGNTISVWDIATGQLHLRFSHQSVLKIAHVGFSADSRRLVAVSGASVDVWSVEEKQRLRQVSGTILVHADVGPDDQSIAAASTDGHSVKLWRFPGGKSVSLSTGGPARTVEFSPDGAWLVATGDARGLRLWSVAGTDPPVDVGADPRKRSAEGQIRCARFQRTPGALRLATGGADGIVRVWEPKGQERVPWEEVAELRGHLKPVLAVEFDATGDRIISVSEDGSARIWGRRSAPFGNSKWELLTVLRGHRTTVTRGQFDPDGHWVLTVGADARIMISDPSHDRELATLGLLHNRVKEVDLDREGGRIAAMLDSGPLMLWSVNNGKLKPVGTQSPWRARFTPDGGGLLRANVGKEMVLYDTVSVEPKATFRGHENSVESIQFDRTGERVVTASNDSTVRLWETKSGALLHTLPGPELSSSDAFFSPDGRLVASVWWIGQTWVWTREGKLEAQLQSEKQSSGHGTFSADGRRLLVTGYGSVRMWDTTTWLSVHEVMSGEKFPSVTTAGWPYVAFGYSNGSIEVIGVGEDRSRRQWTEHAARVTAAVFSVDGHWLLTGDEDGAVRLWDAGNGTLLARLHDHSGKILQLRFSGDSRVWLSLAEDGIVRVHYRRLDDLLQLARARFPEGIHSTSSSTQQRKS